MYWTTIHVYGQPLQGRASRFFIGYHPGPHVSTFILSDIRCHQHTWQAFPTIIAYWKWSNTGGSKGLGMRLCSWQQRRYDCVYVYMCIYMHGNEPHLPTKGRPSCYTKSPTAQNTFQQIQDPISYIHTHPLVGSNAMKEGESWDSGNWVRMVRPPPSSFATSITRRLESVQ